MAALQHQPKALLFLFLTEMWERFGFYVVQGILILYMTNYFGFSDTTGYTMLAIFSALIYISPLIGGFLADKVLGFKVSIVWGGFFLTIGYALLALPYAKLLFYPALAVLIVGNGLFKPNISSLLGIQYADDDPERDAGFTIFYIGINIGSSLSGLSAGYIKEYFGWHMSFALASLGIIIGLITFGYGLKRLKPAKKTFVVSRQLTMRLFAYCLLAITGLCFLLNMHVLADWLLPCIGIVLLVYLTMITLQQNNLYRKRMLVLNVLILSAVVFWTLMLQLFFSANLFVDRLVDKNFFGLHLATTVFYASEGLYIILLGPFFAWIWQTLSRRHSNPSPITKFILGIFFAGLCFVVLSVSTFFPQQNGLIHPLWIFSAYLFITIGELLLSPIGLSAVTLLAPPQLVGMMMGIWFVASGFGGVFAGLAARLASVPDNLHLNTVQKLLIYQHAFLDYAYLAFFVAIVIFFVQLGLNKLLLGRSIS